MRRLRFKQQNRFKAWGAIGALVTLILLVLTPYLYGRISTSLEVHAQYKPVEEELRQVQADKEALENRLEFSSSIQTSEKTKEVARFYIHKYFGKDADKVERVMKCESGLNNLTYHKNKEGLGADHGLYQLNDKFHKSRFEKMYGVPFEIGAYDFDLSSQYAKFLYDHSGLNPWVCFQLLEGQK